MSALFEQRIAYGKTALCCLLVVVLSIFFLQSGLTAPPPDPNLDPATAQDPHKLLDYVGYYGEMRLIHFALSMILGVIDLAILRKFKACINIAGIAILLAIYAIALPGLCILADKDWCRTDEHRFAWVGFVVLVQFVIELVYCGAPIVVAFTRKQKKKFKIIVVLSSILSFLFPIAWIIAMHFAFWAGKEKPVQST